MSLVRIASAFRSNLDSQRGFTLVELVVAVGMLGVALVAMSVMFTLSFATARDAQNRLEAKTEAQRMVERLRTLPYFIAFNDQIPGSDPDILDRFFVNATDAAPGVLRTIDSVPTTGYYTGNLSTTCSQTVSPPECAYISTLVLSKPPTGRLTLMLRFVREPTENGSPLTDPQIVAAPLDFDSNLSGRDTPAASLALATVQIDWTEAGRPLSYTVDSIIYGTRTIPQKSSGLASAGGGKVTGPKFPDGAVSTDLISTLGLTSAETTESDIQVAVAKGTIIDVRQLDPVTGANFAPTSFLLQPNGTATDSRISPGSTVPAVSVRVDPPGQTLFTVDGTGALIGSIGSGAAAAQTTLFPPGPPGHPGFAQPEAMATQTVNDFKLYYRPTILSVEDLTIQNITSTSTVASNSTEIRSTSSTTLTGIRIWGTHEFDLIAGYEGVIKIDGISVSTFVTSNGSFATAVLNWEWRNFRIWNPDLNQYDKADLTASPDCVFESQPDYPACTNIVIPPGYGTPLVGETYENCTTCSLAIAVGPSHEFTSPTGVLAQASQRGLLTFYFKKQGLHPLETTIFTLGSASSEVTYRQHSH